MQLIPFRDFPDFVEDVALDEVVYRLRFAWSALQSAWYFSLLDADGALLVAGAKVVQGKKDRKSTRLNSSHSDRSRMPSSA